MQSNEGKTSRKCVCRGWLNSPPYPMAVPAVSSEASQALHLVIQDSCRGKEEGKIGDRGTETRRFWSDYLFIYLVLI